MGKRRGLSGELHLFIWGVVICFALINHSLNLCRFTPFFRKSGLKNFSFSGHGSGEATSKREFRSHRGVASTGQQTTTRNVGRAF